MESKYHTNSIIIFFRLIFFIILVSPCVAWLIFINIEEKSLLYLPLIVIYSLIITYIVSLFDSTHTLKKDIRKHKIFPYYKFNYEKEEWKSYIQQELNNFKKVVIKVSTILIPIIVLFYFIGIYNQDYNILRFFSLALLNILISFAFYNYIKFIKPLTDVIDSNIREIAFYNAANVILANQYVIDFHGRNIHYSLYGITLENNKKDICFTTAVNDYESGINNKLFSKKKIPIPEKEYSKIDKTIKQFQEKLIEIKYGKDNKADIRYFIKENAFSTIVFVPKIFEEKELIVTKWYFSEGNKINKGDIICDIEGLQMKIKYVNVYNGKIKYICKKNTKLMLGMKLYEITTIANKV